MAVEEEKQAALGLMGEPEVVTVPSSCTTHVLVVDPIGPIAIYNIDVSILIYEQGETQGNVGAP
jgi:hypothetical protein